MSLILEALLEGFIGFVLEFLPELRNEPTSNVVDPYRNRYRVTPE